MTLRDAWAVAGPLLKQGMKWYAPQIKIPADLAGQAMKYFGRAKKGSKKVRKEINKIDDMISTMENKLGDLKKEREEWVLHWADLVELMESVQRFKGRIENGK